MSPIFTCYGKRVTIQCISNKEVNVAQAQNFRFKCRNTKCGYEGLRRYNIKEFEELQYPSGISCFYCGFPKMFVMRSKRQIDDTFKPGFQPGIGKYAWSKKEYDKMLKDMGLIELGYEDMPEHKEGKVKYWTDDMIKRAYDLMGGLEGNEIKRLTEDDGTISV